MVSTSLRRIQILLNTIYPISTTHSNINFIIFVKYTPTFLCVNYRPDIISKAPAVTEVECKLFYKLKLESLLCRFVVVCNHNGSKMIPFKTNRNFLLCAKRYIFSFVNWPLMHEYIVLEQY